MEKSLLTSIYLAHQKFTHKKKKIKPRNWREASSRHYVLKRRKISLQPSFESWSHN